MGDAGGLVEGDPVLMAGNPVGMGFTVHAGMVSHVGRNVLGVAYVQIDAKVNPGNSGGPLVDREGRVVGIVSLKRTDAEGIGLALPINYAYPDQKNLVTPTRVPDPAVFRAFLEKSRAEDERTVAEVRDTLSQLRPFIASIANAGPAQIRALVGQPAREKPQTVTYTFEFKEADRPTCPVEVVVSEWAPVPAGQSGSARPTDPRVLAWIERNGLKMGLFVGQASLSATPCGRNIGPGVHIAIAGGDPENVFISR